MSEVSLEEKDYKAYKSQRVAKPLLWFGMISIVMLFAGLTSAVLVRKGDGNWNSFELPDTFLWSTIVILVSSLVLVWANMLAKKDKLKQLKTAIGINFALGVAFVILQFIGYQILIDNKVYFTGAEHNASGSFLYVISLMHLLHLIGGMVALAVVFFNALREKYSSKNLLGLQVCSIYWHFMGGLWIYLYFFFRMVI